MRWINLAILLLSERGVYESFFVPVGVFGRWPWGGKIPTFNYRSMSSSLAEAAVKVCFFGDFGGSICLFMHPETHRSCLISSLGVVGLCS